MKTDFLCRKVNVSVIIPSRGNTSSHSAYLLFKGRTRTATRNVAIINQDKTKHIKRQGCFLLRWHQVCLPREHQRRSISRLIITPGASFSMHFPNQPLGCITWRLNTLHSFPFLQEDVLGFVTLITWINKIPTNTNRKRLEKTSL